MKLKINKDVRSQGIEVLKAFNFLEEVSTRDHKDFDIMDKVKIVSLYCGQPIDFVKNIKASIVMKAFDEVIDAINSYKPKEVKLKYEINGVTYLLQETFSTLPASWFIDSTNVTFEDNPALLFAFCYIEEGMTYCEMDKHRNIKNPLKNRVEVFEKVINIGDILDLSAFFLLKHKLYKTAYTLIKEAKEQRQIMKQSNGNGRN